MTKRFIASAAGIKVSKPGVNVDAADQAGLIFSSDRFTLSGALIGSFFVEGASYSSSNGYGYTTVTVPLPAGSGPPIWWIWASFDAPLRTYLVYTSYREATNELEFKVWRNRDSNIGYLIYRNRL